MFFNHLWLYLIFLIPQLLILQLNVGNFNAELSTSAVQSTENTAVPSTSTAQTFDFTSLLFTFAAQPFDFTDMPSTSSAWSSTATIKFNDKDYDPAVCISPKLRKMEKNSNITDQFGSVSSSFEKYLRFPRISNDKSTSKRGKMSFPRAISLEPFQKYLEEKDNYKIETT